MGITPSPYKGLMPYTEEDAGFFFGRDRDCDIIIANLFASRLTILFGASGVGKSSVLQAGVAHRLRQKEGIAVVVFNDWHEAPLENLRQAIQDEIKQVLGSSLDQEEAMPFEDFLADCASRIDGQLVIILDQFEEYLLYHPSDEGPGAFAAEFARVVNSRDVPVSFLIAIREDSLAKLDRFKGRIPQLFGNYLRLDHLDEKAAREAIEKPLEKVGWEWEAELVEAVIDQVQVGRIGLGEVGRGEIHSESLQAETRVRIETPFLQIVMTRLWDEEQIWGSRQIHRRTLDNLGGAKQIVRDYLDAFMDGLPHEHQAISAAVFHYLVTPSGTKIAQSAGDLAVYADEDRKQIAQVLSTLAGPARLLRTVAAVRTGGEPRYEIYHDSLAPAVLHWRGRYHQRQREIRVRRWAIGLGILFVVLASLSIVLSLVSREIERSAAWAAADTTATIAKATAQAGAETVTAALDSKNQATADFRAWQTAQAQSTAASIRLATVVPQPGGTSDPTAIAVVETATAAAQSLQIAEQKVVAAAAELKATATAAASATAVARELREQIQTDGLTGRGVKVAILSTGIDATHPDFGSRIVATKDFTGVDIRDGNGSGTCVASIVAGSGAASGGLYKGWAPEADLYIAKVLSAGGAGTLKDVIASIEWAVEQEVDIVLIDVGSASNCDGSDELSLEADAAVEAGLVVVVSAGNWGPEAETVGSPGCARLPITVGAAQLNTVADFSSRGPTLDGRTKPDLLFPHSGVGAQAPDTKIGSVVAPGYVEVIGSSISAAHAAGAIALLLQSDPDLTPAEVKDLLMETAIDLGFDPNDQGAGLADIKEALASVADWDEDGVPDVEDACPDEPGSSLTEGCPGPIPPTPTPSTTPTATPTAILTPTPTPTATPMGKIAFTLWNGARYDVWVANADGSGRTKIIGDMRQPAFSPDGSRIAVNGERSDRMNLHVADANGSNLIEVSEHLEDSRPSWSPDGNRIVFDSTAYGDEKLRIYILDDVTERTGGRVLRNAGGDTLGRDPFWLPDGRIVYKGCDYWAGGATCGLYIVPPDGSAIPTQLITDGNALAPTAYGNKVVFMSIRDGNWEIYSINTDGSNLKRLTNNGVKDGLPTFSPNGQVIAFVSDEGGKWAVWAMNADGSGRRKLFDLNGGYGIGKHDWTTERISWAPHVAPGETTK